jgi:hypothetical protein
MNFITSENIRQIGDRVTINARITIPPSAAVTFWGSTSGSAVTLGFVNNVDSPPTGPFVYSSGLYTEYGSPPTVAGGCVTLVRPTGEIQAFRFPYDDTLGPPTDALDIYVNITYNV